MKTTPIYLQKENKRTKDYFIKSFLLLVLSIWFTVPQYAQTPCTQFDTGPFTDFNPVSSSCFNDCTPTVFSTFQVFQNESYKIFNLAAGESYTFEFCNGYDANIWEALITVAAWDEQTETVVPNSDIATVLGCTINFTVPTTGDYIIIISDPTNCGGPNVSVNNGFPTLVCTGNVSCCGALFTDDGGQFGDYDDDENYTATMCPDNFDEYIEVDFTSFSLEDSSTGCFDGLQIYNGDNTSAPLINEYCDTPGGPGSPGTVTADNTTGCLTFEFASDGSVEQAGWEANVSCVTCPEADNISTSNVTADGFDVSWTSGANVTSSTIFLCPVEVNPGDPSCIEISNVTSPHTFTGLPNCAEYEVYVRQTCNERVSEFPAEIASVVVTIEEANLMPVCGETVVYPVCGPMVPYQNNENVVFMVCPDNTTDVVSITFTYFDIKVDVAVFNRSCSSDFVTIKDVTSGANFGSFCSEESVSGINPFSNQDLSLNPTFTGEAPGNCLMVSFTSDANDRLSGFSFDVSCVFCTGPSNVNAYNFNEDSFDVSWDPGYNAVSADIEICPQGTPAEDPSCISFEGITSNPFTATGLTTCTMYDVYVREDCGTEESAFEIDTVEGRAIAPQPMNNLSPSCGDVITYPTCGAPFIYENNENFNYTVCPDVATDLISVTFTHFDLEVTFDGLACRDFVTISDATTMTNFGMFCSEADGDGDAPPAANDLSLNPTFTAEGPGNCLTIAFTSNPSNRGTGFSFDVSCVPPPVCTLNVGDLIITEIMQNPNAVGDAQGEYFEVYNTTGASIDMMGLIIADGGSDSHTISSSLMVPAGGYAVLGINGDATTNGGVTVDYVYSGFNLSNSDDEVIIVCVTTEIDRVNYDGGPGFPDPTGASMSLDPNSFNDTANDSGENWCESTTVIFSVDFGTPGTANDSCAKCDGPSNVNADNFTNTNFDVSWDSGGNALTADIEVCPQGTPAEDPACISFTNVSNPFTATGLTTCVIYDVYVKENCGVLESEFEIDTVEGRTIIIESANNLSPNCGATITYPACGPPFTYENNEDFTYTVCPDVVTNVVSVTFTYFDLEVDNGSGCFDFVRISDATTGTNFGDFCSEADGDGNIPPAINNLSQNPTFTAEGPGNCLTIRFQSDGVVQETGFSFTVSCIPACPDDYAGGGLPGSQPALTGFPNESLFYQTSGSIISDQGLGLHTPNITVEYKAGLGGSNSIELLAGFEVNLGVDFHAFFGGCN